MSSNTQRRNQPNCDGTDHLVLARRPRRRPAALGLELFDYGKYRRSNHFLLSNIKYWLARVPFRRVPLRRRHLDALSPPRAAYALRQPRPLFRLKGSTKGRSPISQLANRARPTTCDPSCRDHRRRRERNAGHLLPAGGGRHRVRLPARHGRFPTTGSSRSKRYPTNSGISARCGR